MNEKGYGVLIKVDDECILKNILQVTYFRGNVEVLCVMFLLSTLLKGANISGFDCKGKCNI